MSKLVGARVKILIIILMSITAKAQIEVSFEKSKWTELEFGKVPKNKVEYSESLIRVNVDSSASPLIYKLDQVINVSSFEVSLNIRGSLLEEKEFEEDSYFRLGLVALGDERLGGVGQFFVPKWVKQLFALAPKGAGLDKIYFYNVTSSKNFLDKERVSPLSKYIFEKVIAVKNMETIDIKYTLKKPLQVTALWMSIDGDSTKSKFTTEIKKIRLYTP